MANNHILTLGLLLLLSSQLPAYRLPTTITPFHYEVHLTIPRDTFTASGSAFQGTAVIDFNLTAPTSEIKFHASNNFITITDIALDNVAVPAADYSRNATTDILTITVNSILETAVGYQLRINYESRLSVSDMQGFYKSSYVDADGVTKYLATTQFQPTHARRAFPCWDEPAFKATFDIGITYPNELNALSNTPGTILTIDGVNNLATIQFERTPVMSAYLIAFIVSDFTCTSGESVGTTPHRVCSRPETADIRGWAVEVGSQILASLNAYTDYDYSLATAKMDQVAIPDFAAGAMENWGLVTYRETGLLWDPEESSNSNKQSIAAVIAHEFTHMWFGNLVTCNWWSETFLNEGFARFLQYFVLDDVLPDWELNKQFVVLVLQLVLDTDSYVTAQALQSEAVTPSQVSAKFGTITYAKGASVFRMVQHVMGLDNFRDGLRSYLREYQYSSTIPQNLWTSLSAHVDNTTSILPSDLNTVMQNWVESSGYPLLTVTLVGRTVSITQERFLLSGSDTTSRWYVPVSLTRSFDSNKFQSTTPEGWLTPTDDLTITLPEDATWVIVNNKQAGYYRVNYDSALWGSIASALLGNNFSEIPDENRAQIVDDAFNLAKVNKLEYSRVFEVLEFLETDVTYYTWHRAFSGFNYLIDRIGQETVLGRAITGHLSRLMVNLYQSVPLTNLNESNQIYTLNQVSAVNWACRLGLEDCINDARTVFSAYKINGTRPNKNLKSLVYCNGLRYSDDNSDWEFLWQEYLSTELATERAVLIPALGCTKNEAILREYLFKSIDTNSGIRSQDASSVFAAVYNGNPVGVDVAFNFLIENYQAIDDYYQSMNSLATLLNGIASRFRSQRQITQLQNFIATGDLSESFLAAATQALATAQANVAWVNGYKIDLDTYYGITLADEVEDEIDENESTLAYYRLSSIFQPSHYEIHLNTTGDIFTATGNSFTGTVVVYFYISRPTTSIRMHSSNVNIAIETIELNNQVIPSEDYSVNSTTDILTINYPTGLTIGTLYGLRIFYTGRVDNSDFRGFYKSSYVNADNVTRYLLTTQFEPVHARRAFPCFDEPSFKATFQVLITHPSELNVWSNTLGTVVQNDTYMNTVTTQFNKTPVMSTYLLAFVISDFTCTQGDNIDAAPYQVCSRDNQREYRAWAVEAGPKLLASLNAYTGYNYSNAIEKMDQFAIPDFASGAMENWGLVTYREASLLWDPLVSTNSAKDSVTSTIAHEFAHMWFGNLVTCKWWSEITLNEGFAAYFQYFTTHDVFPDWELDKQFVVRTVQGVLTTDSYLTSQALQSPASTPTQISNKFGTISYSKGGSIFHMVEHIMGPENFRTGLQSYLQTYQFSNTKPEDLWSVLANFIDPNISQLPVSLETVMANWIKTSGFPLLSVSIVGNNIVISQERFLLSGQDTSSRWYVPVSYTTSVDPITRFESTAPNAWLTPSANLEVPYPTGAQWVVLNNQQTAFFRVQYSNELWDALAVALRSPGFSGIPELNRAQIVDDVFEFTKIDTISYARAFRVLEFLENDVSYFPWYSVATEFNTLFTRVGLTTPIGRAMHAHVLRLVSNFYESVPVTVIDEDNQLYTMKQITAVNLACRLGQTNCVAGIRELYYNYSRNGIEPPKNLKSIVYCNGIRHSDNRSDWDALWQTYTVTDLASEASLLITALGCSEDKDILWDYLNRAINPDSGIRRAHTSSAFSAVYSNAAGVDVALRFVTENLDAIYNYYQSWSSVGSLFTGIAGRITSESQIRRLQNFIRRGALSGTILTAANQALATAQTNLGWIYEHKIDLDTYYGITLADEIEDEIDENESTLPQYRLSSIFQPSYYQIHLNVTQDAFTATGNSFIGTVVVYFTTSRPTTSIRMHSSNANIAIQTIELNNQVIPSGDYSINTSTDILTINYPASLTIGTLYALRISYTGTFGNLNGFYKSSYVNAENVTTYLLTTQFEPVSARRAFPCFDEPSFKATFQVLITHPSELNAWCNTPGSIVQRDTYMNTVTTQFNRTPVMSTYLLAFVVSDFTCTQGDNIDTAPYQVCSRDNQREYRAWAVEVGPKLLASLNAYTGYNYTNAIEKMDQFAIPDFSAGAMENWGLVTYREASLLWNPLVSTNSAKDSVTSTIAHEFAHMWFGNLVTCQWWSEITMNEGFAAYFQYFTTHDVFPNWELDKQFVVRTVQGILSTDSYLTSQALQSPASTPTQISNKFGSISYSKGGSILRMVEHIMGPENFRAGLQNYLQTYTFSNTKPEDLWFVLSNFIDPNVSQLPVRLETVMANWIKTSGFPLLHVSIVGNNLVISQERFLLSGQDSSSKWYVPISYTTSVDSNRFASTAPNAWLTPSSNLEVPYPTGAQWVVLNTQQTGFYRVHYSNELWDALAVALRSPDFSGIPELNRAQIVDDVFEFTKINTISYTRAFRVLEFLEDDSSYFPWYSVATEFNSLFTRVGLSTRLGRAMHAHVLRLVSNFYESVPVTVIDEDDQLYTMKQVTAVNLACRLGQPNCVSGIREIYYNYSRNGIEPPKNLKSIVYCNGIRHSDNRSDWDALWQTYTVTDLASEASLLITALGCSDDESILWDYLNRAINPDSGIQRAHTASAFSAVYSNAEGVDVALRFVIENLDAIYNYYQNWNSVGSLITGIAGRLTSEAQIRQLQNFIATGNLNGSILNVANQALTTAQSNLAWVYEHKIDLDTYYGITLADEIEDEIDERESTLPHYRLSSIFQPSYYQIHLNTPRDTFTATGNSFIGTVVVYFTTSRPTLSIRMHASNVNIAIETIELNNQVIPSGDYSVNSTTDILTINYPTGLTIGTAYALRISYTGRVDNSDFRGFYKSSYVNAENVTSYLLTTQFEPVHARRAFPCFDEPSFKATFQIIITHPSELNVRSNTLSTVVQRDTVLNTTTTQFNISPVMSTYLNAFIISDFTCTQGENIDTAPYHICSRDNQREYRDWAVQIGPPLLASLNAYTGYNYSSVMEKMDQYAIPDFASGAMENWGLVTYTESNLLWNPLVSTNSAKQSIATVIAHEFTHMWFGNLVTCKWWSETFLNEGFARYFQYYTTHEVLPDWELDKQFVVVTQQTVLTTDSYLTSQPLQSPASTPTDISNKFGTITYSKGASVLRMVEHFMGPVNYRAALQSYLETYQFTNTKPEALWSILTNFIDPNVSQLPTDLETVMSNWIRTAGFPVLYVSIVSNNIIISQERFLLSGADTSSRWYVPISYTTSVDSNSFESTAPNAWLTPSSNLRVPYPTGAQWVVLNNHQTAFYRVQYSNELWDSLAVALRSPNFSGIPELNRAQIVDDIFEFTQVERISYTRAFRVLEFLENDVSYFPWYSVATEFNNLFVRVGLTTRIGRAMHAHVLQLVSNFYESVPVTAIDEDNQLYTLKQITAVNLACRLGQPNCVSDIRELYYNYSRNGVAPPKNLKSIVYCNGIRHSDNSADWDDLWETYTVTDLASEASLLITALGCSADENILTEYLHLAINPGSGIRRTHTSSVFSAVYSNAVGVDVALRFVIENLNAIYNYYESWSSVGSIITGIGGRISTEEQLAQLQGLLTSGELNSSLTNAVNSAISTAQTNLNWIETYRSDFHEYYELGEVETTTTSPTTPTTPIPTTTPVEITTPSAATSVASSLVLVLVVAFVNNFYFN